MAKSPEAFRTISEAAAELGVAQHVLRFWETKFTFVRPMKRAGGRRFYRPADIVVLAAVRRLLYDEGYTIRGVQKLHREHGLKPALAGAEHSAGPARPTSVSMQTPVGDRSDLPPGARAALESALETLLAAKARLDALTASR